MLETGNIIVADAPHTHGRFRTMFERHHDEISRYCHRRLPAPDANDATSDVFAVAWRRLADIPDGAEILWLYGVARNVVARYRRGAARRMRLVDKVRRQGRPPDPGPEAVVVRHAEEQLVFDALATLKPDDREVLLLKTWEELSHAQIAAVLGVATHAVDMRVSRALQRLRHAVDSTNRMPRGER